MRTHTRSRRAGLVLLLAAGGILAVVIPQTAQAATTTYQVTATVPAGNTPWQVAVDTLTNKVYVTDLFGRTVSVIDGLTNTLLSTISIGYQPTGIAVDEATDKIYVTVAGDSLVAVIDGASDTVTSTIAVGPAPSAVAVDETTNTIYVVNQQGDSLSEISGVSGTVISTVYNVGVYPDAVAVDETTHAIFVANSGDNTVSVIHPGLLVVSAIIPVGADPDGVAVDEATHTVYVANGNDLQVANGNTVSVINAVANTVTSTVPVGFGATSLDLDATTGTVYVVNSQGSTVSVIDGVSHTVTSTIVVGTRTDSIGVAVNAMTNTVYVSNANKNTVSVISVSVSPTITTASLPGGTIGAAYSSTVSASGTPALTFSVSAGALPAGVSLDATSGLISGTPTSVGSFTFTIKATNTVGFDSHAYTVSVDPVPLAPTITTASLPDAIKGDAYSSTISASGFPAPTFSVSAGDIGPGLSLDAITGVVSGTPIFQGTATFTITATNTLGSDSHAYSLVGGAPPSFDLRVLPNATVGTAYSFAVGASGFPRPTFTVSAGALPDGLSLDPITWLVSGTPTTPGTDNFTITATNYSGTDARAFTITVAAVAPLITSTSEALAGEVVDTAYSATITASGTGPITFTVTAGALPAGLTLDTSTGTVSGPPTTAGSATFTITATNTAGSDPLSFTVIVAAATPRLAPTGFDALPWGAGGTLTLLVGAALLILAARRRRGRTSA
jgi:YVTN family beta-propeller protein